MSRARSEKDAPREGRTVTRKEFKRVVLELMQVQRDLMAHDERLDSHAERIDGVLGDVASINDRCERCECRAARPWWRLW